MKFNARSLLAVVATSSIRYANSECVVGGFDLTFQGYCNYENILAKFRTFFDNPVNQAAGCTNTAEQELNILLGGSDIDAAIKSICKESVDNFDSLDFDDIPRAGPDFVREYYNGNTEWNEEHETSFPLDDHDNPTNILRSRQVNGRNIYGDAGNVKNVFDGAAQYGVISWPGHLSNFELDKCTTNTAMCCWPSDRQADDNNGNCATPYDSNCEDSDPSDNTNLCYVDFEKGVLSTGFAGTGNSVHNGDDGNNQYEAEGPIHCHGFAWANDESDFTSSYKANNLFFVSMYDHMSQRGYVRNIQGAPMCACTEQMPIVSRSDCTQVDVDEEFEIHYDGEQWSGKLAKVYIDFNACEGFDRRGNNDNNDLWAYMNRLYREEKITIDQLMEIGKVLVGDDPDMCGTAVNDFYSSKGKERGHNEDNDVWVKIAGVHSLNMDEPFGKQSFDTVFAESPNQIALRRCVYCKSYFREIYYKRLTPVAPEFNHYWHLLNGNIKDEDYYVYGEDFELYSTYEDAVLGLNEWGCTNYRYDQYFPGNCRPDGGDESNVGARMNPHQGRSDVAWYVEKSKGKSTGITDLTSTNIGNVEIAGTVRSIDNSLYITGSGDGIEGGANQLNFYEEETHSDLAMNVNITDFDARSGWSRAGLMIRDSLDPLSKYVMLSLTGSYGISMSWRDSYGEHYGHHETSLDAQFAVIKLERKVNQYTASYLKYPEIDEEGMNVAVVGVSSQSSTNHDGHASRANDGNTNGIWQGNSVTHSGNEREAWWKVDLQESFPIHTVKLYTRTDCCQDRLQHFQVQLLDDDGSLVASKDYDTPGFAISVTISFEDIDASQVKVQMKDTGISRVLSLAEVKVFTGETEEVPEPAWVVLREVNVDMSETVNAGLAVTSRSHDELSEAVFYDYDITRNTYPSASPSLSLAPTMIVPSRDVGNHGLVGSSSVTSDGRYVLTGSGRDIWNNDDGFHFMKYIRPNNMFIMTAHVDSFNDVEQYAKAGIMARTFICNESPMVFIGRSRGRFYMIWREQLDHNAQEVNFVVDTENESGWVKLEKYGDEYSGYYKVEEEDEWVLLKTVNVSSKEPDMHVGLVVSSHNNNALATATFSDFSIEDATRSPTSSPVPTMTPPDLYLWPAGSTSECPEGASVPQDDCLEAALLLIENSDIFQPLTSSGSLMVDDWNFTPCGCFLWRENNSNTYYIDFDTSTTACVADNRGNSICTVPPPSRRVLRTT